MLSAERGWRRQSSRAKATASNDSGMEKLRAVRYESISISEVAATGSVHQTASSATPASRAPSDAMSRRRTCRAAKSVSAMLSKYSKKKRPWKRKMGVAYKAGDDRGEDGEAQMLGDERGVVRKERGI